MKRAVFTLMTLCALAGAALAQSKQQAAPPAQSQGGKSNAVLSKHDSNQPINIAADKVQADLNAKTVTYSGNVVVIQGDIRMHADDMKVNTTDGKAQNITANGHVVVDSPASGTATGDAAVYDVTPRTVTLTGRVVLTRAKDVMRGSRLTVNLVTGQATLGAPGASGAAASSGGRVQGVFTPSGGN